MKKRMMLLLWAMVFLLLMSCAKSNSKAEIPGNPIEKEKPRNDRKKTEEDFKSSENKESQESENGKAEERTMEAWEQAYLEYITSLEYAGSYTYSLIYVDEDEIPELVKDTGVEAGGCEILTWHEGVLDILQTYRLNFTYIEKKNLLCNSDGLMGYYYDSVYTIEDGQWSFFGGGEYHDPESGPQLDENDDFIYEYYWLKEPVEEEEYQERFHAIYPENEAGRPKLYYIKDEMCSLLKTGEVTSVDHRYELIVEDLTWTQARKACVERGGYLATLTSQEEFERVQAQILAEEKTAVTFFVGAANQEPNWGFRWLEPGVLEGYYILDLYNALFSGFWLEGEPSYTGLTEEGEEVRETCVSLIYRSSEERCYLNDVPDDILEAAPSFAGRVGYICEYNE